MAIVDQKTDLKKLKYAEYATYSTPPIIKDINDPPKYNRFSKPFLARADDLVRMGRLLTANRGKLSPSASNFLATQATIATVKTINAVQKAKRNSGDGKQSFKDVAGAVGSEIGSTAVDAGKIIAGLLAQTPVAGTGTHFIYAPAVGTQYLKESGEESGGSLGFLRRAAAFAGIGTGGGINGASLALQGGSIIADSKPIEGSFPNRNIEFEDNTAADRADKSSNSIKNTFEKSKLRTGLDKLNDSSNYQKGITEGGSFGQVFNGEYLQLFGKTSLQAPRTELQDGTVRYFLGGFEDKDRVNTSEENLNQNKTSKLNVNAREQNKSKGEVDGKFNKEFGKVSDEDKAKTIYVKATKKGLGNPFGVGESYGSDQLNLFGGDGETIDDTFLTVPIPNEISEIIPFEFQVFDPNRGGKTQYLYFRAYLDTFSDNYTGNWNGTKYIGRAEEVYNYTGFNREVTFNFKIAAMSDQELQPLYRKLNFFAGVTAPSYDPNSTFMRGVYTKVSIGDYLQAVPGFFSSINLSWSTEYPWEVGFNKDGTENDIPRNPIILDVSTTFKPIHNFNPQLGSSFIGSSRRSINA